MKQQTNPIEKALRIVIIGVFVLTTVLSLVSCGEQSMHTYSLIGGGAIQTTDKVKSGDTYMVNGKACVIAEATCICRY